MNNQPEQQQPEQQQPKPNLAQKAKAVFTSRGFGHRGKCGGCR